MTDYRWQCHPPLLHQIICPKICQDHVTAHTVNVPQTYNQSHTTATLCEGPATHSMLNVRIARCVLEVHLGPVRQHHRLHNEHDQHAYG